MQTGQGRALLILLGLALSTPGWTAEGESRGDRDALSSAVERYNSNSGLDSAFRLLQVKSQPDGAPSNPDLQKLELILKETTCPNSRGLNLDDCDFKENGVVKECSGTSSAQPGSPILQIDCDTISQGNRRVKRNGKVRKLLRKLKKILPGGGSIIAHAKPVRPFHMVAARVA
ncbi:cathelicidin-6 [Protobothrops mucrosquamatus]|uniref:cathelicidin-6 n=1 Tax=Protobothrops mucrosquamatus TaxID=103944 RepID=UPI0007755FAA|nr:cathelicidin-6 [Protobothrops mucrosquamatus]